MATTYAPRLFSTEPKNKPCQKCYYFDKHVRCCDYLLIELQRRPCKAEECIEKGIFRAGKRKTDAFGLKKG